MLFPWVLQFFGHLKGVSAPVLLHYEYVPKLYIHEWTMSFWTYVKIMGVYCW
jgi:hypothetical protein